MQIDDYQIYSFYEQRRIAVPRSIVSLLYETRFHTRTHFSNRIVLVEVVGKSSALLQVKNEEQIPVDANHQDMCKFMSSTDKTYDKIHNRITEVLDEYLEKQRSKPCT